MTEAEALKYATKRQRKETVTLAGPASEYWPVSNALDAAGWTVTLGWHHSDSVAPFQIVAERVIEEPKECPRCHDKPRGVPGNLGGWVTCPECGGAALKRLTGLSGPAQGSEE